MTDSRLRTFLTSIRRLMRTLRFRLAAWNALVVVLTALVTLAGLREGVRWTLLNEMDQILIEDLEEIELALAELPRSELSLLKEELERKAAGHKHHGWFVELIDRQDETFWRSADVPAQLPPVSSPQLNRPFTIGNYRLVQRTVAVDDSIGVIRVGATLNFLSKDMARIDRLVMVAASGALTIAPLCGYWLARRAARTVGEIIDTASRLRPSHLDERLPFQGTGDELDQLAQTVNGLLDRINDYLQERRDFLANAAHELRTPLAAIRSSVEVAMAGKRSQIEYQQLLEDIIEEGIALETLVNQLLLLSETEADRLKTLAEQVNLQDVVTKSVEMFRGAVEAKGMSLNANRIEPAIVLGNRTHLRQVVNNLIDNAVKYTPGGGSISVSLTREAPHHVRLVVEDSGVGIAAEDVPHIFNRFFRTDRSHSRDATSGTGLGLSICQAVISAHHGEITCTSALGAGTRFTVLLPACTTDSLQRSVAEGAVA